MLILKKRDQNNQVKHFKVNRNRVERVLRFLCENNPAFIEHGIKFDTEVISQLPIDEVPLDLPYQIDQTDVDIDSILIDVGQNIEQNQLTVDENEQANDDYQAFIETDDDQPLQIDNIKNAINFPSANRQAINEFQFSSICSLIFPKLFPTGAADPTSKSKNKI